MKSLNISSLVRENIRELVPYSAARYEFSGEEATLLDANENPLGGNYNRYPDPWQRKIKKNLAKIKGVPADNIFIGNGADEAIDLLIRAFCEPGKDSIVVSDPTYSMYRVSAQINGNTIVKVPLESDFSLNSRAVLEAIKADTKLIFLCSPMNPSGNLLDHDSVLDVIKAFDGLVIIDEAYIDFTEDPGFLSKLGEFNNLIVLQTFSKAWALAGIRVGMAYGNKEVIDILNKIKPPYNVSGPAQALAIEATKDLDRFMKMVDEIRSQRKILTEFLMRYAPCTKVFLSEANFLLAQFKDSTSLYGFLKVESVIVRDRSFETHCENCLRITVGSDEEIEKLINLLIKYEKETAVY